MSVTKIILICCAALVIGITYSCSSVLGPVDTFPRLVKRVECPNSSLSVAIYRKKHEWFSLDTDIFVRIYNERGNVVHEERLFQLDGWQKPPMVGEAPVGFCNEVMWRNGIRAEIQQH